MDPQKSCSALKDPARAGFECVRLGNKLIRGLSLHIPPYSNEREIIPTHLVEMHCRLMGLSFTEYTPMPQPWKAIDDILLSLRQKFGLNNFSHVDSLLVSTGEPTNLLCLLEIFDTMFEHYRARGRSFSRPVIQDETVLTSSDGPAGSSRLKSSDTSEDELNLIILIDMEDDEVKQIGLENKTQNASRVNVWENQKERAQSPPHPHPHSRKKGDKRAKSSGPPAKPTVSKLFEAPKSLHKHSKPNDKEIELALSKKMKRPNVVEAGQPNTISQSSSQPASTSTPKEFFPYSKIQSKQRAISPTDPSMEKSEMFDGDVSSSPPQGLQSLLNKHYPNKSRSILLATVGNKHTERRVLQPRNAAGHVDIRINIEIEDSQLASSDEPDALFQLNSIHDEIQDHIRRQLSKMERQINSIRQDDCCTSENNVHRHTRARPKTSPYPPCKPGTKFDLFGDPIYERFPYYPRGIIIPRCHSPPPVKCQPKDSTDTLYNFICELRERKLETDSNRDILGSQNSQPEPETGMLKSTKSKRNPTLCAQILTNVLAEFPDTKLGNKLFGRLSRKCEEYVKLMDAYNVSEDEIRKKTEIRMRELVRSSSTATMLDKKLHEAAHRRKSLAKSKNLARSAAAAEREALRQQRSAIAKAQAADIKSQVLKIIQSNMEESQNITSSISQALQEQKKSASTLGADKKARADKIFLEADKQLAKLEKFYTNQLAVFRKHAEMLKKLPNPEKELRKIWISCRLTIQSEIDKCVDKIIENIATIYSKNS